MIFLSNKYLSFAFSIFWCIALTSPSLAQEAANSTKTPHDVTLGSIDRGLPGKIGFHNSSYAELVANENVNEQAPGARVERFTAPNGKPVTVIVSKPRIDSTFVVPAMPAGNDPAEYFTQAIARAGSRKTIVFPKGGVYNFSDAGCKAGGAHLKINAPTDVVIDGNGSLLNFLAPCAGVTFVKPVRIVFRNFTIDWPKLQIASLGTIVAGNSSGPKRNTYDLQIDRPFVTERMPQSYKAINSWDKEHNYWSLQYPDHEVGYNPRQSLSASGQAFGVQSWGKRFAPGEHVLIRHYTTEGDAIDVMHGKDVTLDNITIYSSPGFGVAVLWGSSGFAMTNSKITRLPGRLISTAADALHIRNPVGDVIIENNTFAYQGDDGLNMNTTTFPVASGGTNEVPVWSSDSYIREGDSVAIFNHDMNLVDGPSRIISINPHSSNKTNILTLDHPIPNSVKDGYLVDLGFSGARYVVRNNQFLFNRARGLLLSTAYGLVEDNIFMGQTMYALYLTMFGSEGPGAQDVMIANNKISATGFNGGPGAVVLSRGAMIYSEPSRNPPIHQNIIFMDNLISDVPGPAFYISSANNVVLYQNTLKNTNYLPIENKWNNAGDLNYPVVINDASNVSLIGNAIRVASSKMLPVYVDSATSTGIRESIH